MTTPDLLLITPQDISRARVGWRHAAPAEYKDVLDAKPLDEQQKLVIGLLLIFFLAGSYYDIGTGEPIPYSKVRDALEFVIDYLALGMNKLSQQLLDGAISVDAWHTGMTDYIVQAHIDAAVSARGGLAQMEQADWDALTVQIREQLDYLDNFKKQIQSGEQPLDGRVLVRADMYSDAARATYEATRTRVRELEGYTEERYFLEPDAQHCQGCIDRAAQGWQPIGTLAPIGAEDCLTRDKCSKKYRREDGEEVEG